MLRVKREDDSIGPLALMGPSPNPTRDLKAFTGSRGDGFEGCGVGDGGTAFDFVSSQQYGDGGTHVMTSGGWEWQWRW